MAEGIRYAQKAAKNSEKTNKEMSLYLYLIALGYKLLENAEDTEKAYNVFRDNIIGIKQNETKHFIFGLLLGHLANNKPLVSSKINKFQAFSKQLGKQFHHLNKPLSPLAEYFDRDGNCIVEQKYTLLQTLHCFPFFCRLSIAQLEEMLPHLAYKRYPINRLLLLKKTEVAVILQGSVTLNLYTQNLNVPEIIAHGSNSLLQYRSRLCARLLQNRRRHHKEDGCVGSCKQCEL